MPHFEIQFLLCKWLIAEDLPCQYQGNNTFASVRGGGTVVCASHEYTVNLVAWAEDSSVVVVDMMDDHLVAFLWKLADRGYHYSEFFEGISWMFAREGTDVGRWQC